MASIEAALSGQLAASFAELSSQYRIFYLEDILAEPQEIVHDSFRGVQYISQRCVQGHAASPIQYATHISILDASSGGATFGYIDISPYAGPHGMEMDQTGGYLYADIENDGHGRKGTICVELNSHTIVAFSPLSGQTPPSANAGKEFVAEIDLLQGTITRKTDIPKGGRSSSRGLGTGRFVNISLPAIGFTRKSPDVGSYVLDAVTDSAVDTLRSVLAIPTIYVVSRSVLLI